MEMNYGIERRLAQCAPDLHRRYRDCVVISQGMLCRYENYFPDFTDGGKIGYHNFPEAGGRT